MTLLQLIKTIKRVSLSIPNVNSVVDEFLDLNDVTAKYSSVILQQRNHQRNNDFMVFSFYLGYSDRLTEDKSNEIEVQSTGIQVINNIVSKLEDLGFDTTMGSYNVFTERFLAEAAGCYVELSINIPVGECEDDFSKEELDATITKNGVYNYLPTTGLGYQSVHLNITVPTAEINNQTKDELITVNNKKYTYTPDKDYTGIGKLNVMVQIPEQPIYEEGYVVGKEDGINEQKRKLTDIEIVENGNYERQDGYKKIEVNVPTVNNQEKSITITENGQTDIVPDTDYTGLSKIGINVNINTQSYYDNGYSQGKIDGKEDGIAEQKAKLTDLNITENGTYTREDGYGSITVDVPSSVPDLRETEITPKTTEQIITPDGFDGYNKITVKAVDSSIDSEIKPENIKSGANILGVEGNLEGVNNQEKSITINSNGTSSITPDTGYTGISKINITTNVPTSGGDGIDFSVIGYDDQDTNPIQQSLNYSKQLKDNYINVYPDTDEDFPVRGENFVGYEGLVYVPLFDTTDRQDFNNMFKNCPSLSIVPKLPMTNATTCAYMFSNCPNIQYIPNLNLPNVGSFYCMFLESGLHFPLTLTNLSKTKQYGISNMFTSCKIYSKRDEDNYIELDLSMCHDATRAFYFTDFNTIYKSKIILHNTNKITSWGECFAYSNVETITGLDVSNARETQGMDIVSLVYGCENLKNIEFEGSINDTIIFYSKLLTYNSVKSILTAAANTKYSSVGDEKIIFNQPITLTDQNQELQNLVAQCTEKGWKITGLTITQ